MQELDHLLQKIDQWRANKAHRTAHMPLEFWRNAAALADIHSVRVVSSQLKLNSKRLRSFMTPQENDKPQQFFKLPSIQISESLKENRHTESLIGPKLVFEVSGITIKVFA